MIYAIIALAGVIIGCFAGWLIGKGHGSDKLIALEAEKARLLAEKTAVEQHAQAQLEAAAQHEKLQLDAMERQYTERLEAAARQSQTRLEASQEQANTRIEAMKQQVAKAEQLLADEQERSNNAAEAADRQWKERFENLKTELGRLQAETLAARQSQLAEQNSRQMGEILDPVRKKFEEFTKAAQEGKAASEVGRQSLKDAFEATFNLFKQQQEQTVEQLREQSSRISRDTASLCQALRGDNRRQGQWGEMVLSSVLEKSGLIEGQTYFLQTSQDDDEGNRQRPDVIVALPDSRKVIIDSKVSLTAFADAIDMQDCDPEAASRRMKDHAKSVRSHVDELARKNYAASQKNSVEFVLMFMPTDSSFLAALREDPKLVEDAYNKHIAIITPSNLLMSLKLINYLWQHERQERNVEQIVKRGNELYDKMALLKTSLDDIGNSIRKLGESYEQLTTRFEGRGGLISKFESLKKLGLNPKKRIPGAPDETDDEPEERVSAKSLTAETKTALPSSATDGLPDSMPDTLPEVLK